MDEIKPGSNPAEAKKQTTENAPLSLIIVKEETPKDAGTRGAKGKAEQSDIGLTPPPKRVSLGSRI